MAEARYLMLTFKPPEYGVVIAATAAKLEIRLKKLEEDSFMYSQLLCDFQDRCERDTARIMNNAPYQNVYEDMSNTLEQFTVMAHFQRVREEQRCLDSDFTRNEREIELVLKHINFITLDEQDLVNDCCFLEAMNFRKEAIRLETELKFKEELVSRIIKVPQMKVLECSLCNLIGIPVTSPAQCCPNNNRNASILVLDAYLASENREFKKLFGSDLKPIKCPHCDSAFDGIAVRNEHMHTAHRNRQ